MTAPRVLAKFDDYPGFLAALRARASERKVAISSENSHHVTGLSDRRISQMLSIKTLQNLPNARRVGMLSLGPLLGFLGTELWLVESEWAMRKFDKRLGKRNEIKVQNTIVHMMRSKRDFAAMGKKGGKARLTKMTAKHRIAVARKGGLMRWADIKAAVKR